MGRFNNLKLWQKVSLGFGLITIILIGVLFLTYISVEKNSQLFSEVSKKTVQVDYVGEIESNFLHCRVAFKSILLEKSFVKQAEYNSQYLEMQTLIEKYVKTETNQENLLILRGTETLINEYNSDFENITLMQFDILASKNSALLNDIVITMDRIGPRISDNLERLKSSLISQKDDISNEYQNNINAMNATLIIFAVFGLLIALLVSFFFTRFILKPILKLSNAFKNISEGDTDMKARLRMKSNDEIGKMAKYFDLFMDKLEVVYDEIEKQNKVKTKQSQIYNITRVEESLEIISSKIIKFICESSGAYIGAIYVKDEDDNFYLKGNYAQDFEGTLKEKISIKKGTVVGQVIQDKQIKIIESLPDDYIKVTTALGDSLPKKILIIPCCLANEVVCVVELATFLDFSDETVEILTAISFDVAIGINTTRSRQRIFELYQKNLQQTEELRVQQEELMQSHEELTEQTKNLIEKDDMLQVQQEELKVINSELENRNEELESQKEELTVKAKELQLSNKYKSEFLANISHELKTPLNSIMVLSELLMKKSKSATLSEKEMEYASTIHNSGNELLVLITDILDISKVEAGKIDINKDDIDTKSLCEYFQNSFQEIAQSKKIEFNIVCDNKKGTIYTDDLRLKQIIKNLLSNAIKFTEKGKVELSFAYENGKYYFSVSDTGIGIDKSNLESIFEAFTQADGTINRRYGGTGLGLSISKQLARLLGGDIVVESKLNVGSKFTLILPGSETVLNEKKEKAKEPDVQKIFSSKIDSILIIEDDEVFSSVLVEYANEKGLTVYTAFDGAEGLRIAKEYTPDAIIMDMKLPGLSGDAIIIELEKEEATKNIPVHIISGFDSNEILSRESVFSFLKKPVTVKQIQKVFNELQTLSIKTFKNVLMICVSDNDVEGALNQKEGIEFVNVMSGKEAFDLVAKEQFDCIILDKQLQDMSSSEFLAKIFKDGKLDMPVIIYTDEKISMKEEEELSKYSDSIIIRGSKSIDRLISETDIFLYSLGENAKKRKTSGKTNKLIEENGMIGKTVLIVDDDVRNIFSITGILESKGMKVVVARNGKDGLETFTKTQNIDLIIMDIMMPVVDGYETIKQIRKTSRGHNVPIIVITAKSMPEDKNKSFEVGANDYLTKPINVDKLISLLRVWLYK